MTPLLWTLVAIQIAMGAFDTFYHHEFTERLAWRPSQRRELQLHSVRNTLYALLFLVLGWLEVHGVLAIAVLVVLVVLSALFADFIAPCVPLMRGTLRKPAEQPTSTPPGKVSFGIA